MRKFIIDVDPGNDDAVALLMGLRVPQIEILAVTVVCGNVSLEKGVDNALRVVELAGTYTPPVYAGMARPIIRPLHTAEQVHGDNGLGGVQLPEPKNKVQPEHAVDAIIKLVKENPGQVEIVTLGPLTNLALAFLKAPDVMKNIKSLYAMGSCGFKPGTNTPVSDFNVFVDGEATQILLNMGANIHWVGLDTAFGDSFLDTEDMRTLKESGNPIAQFAVDCNVSRYENNSAKGLEGIELYDPAALAAAIWPQLITKPIPCFGYVELVSEMTYGQLVLDYTGVWGKEPNCYMSAGYDGAAFKQKLFKNLLG